MKTIELTQGYTALVDDENFKWLNQYNWCALHSGNNIYAYGRVNGKLILMHRLILGIENQLEFQGDHINHDTLNNQECNIRIATNGQNQRNSKKRRTWGGRPTSSQFKGVSWDGGSQRWRVAAKLNNKRIYLGRYNTEVEAARSYNKFAKEHFGEFARLNKIEQPIKYKRIFAVKCMV